jgi:putative salt-induced outer membrane protein YdiY
MTGNSSTQTLGLAGDVTFRPNPWEYSARLAFAQTRDEGEVTARSLASLARAQRTLTPTLSFYGQYDYLRDLFAGIEQRHTGQGGISYLAFNRAPHRLRLDGGIGFEDEQRLGADDINTTVLTGGARYRWEISKTSELVEEARATLPVPDVGPWKVDQTLSLTAAISSVFSLKCSNVVRFVNEPVPGFERTDTITSIALVMKVRQPAR